MSEGPTHYADGLCGICPAGCWVRAGMRDGKLVDVEPLPDHPLGMICTIGKHSPAVVHDPDRIQTPLRRVGPKGSLAFEPISWDEAYELWVGKLLNLTRRSVVKPPPLGFQAYATQRD